MLEIAERHVKTIIVTVPCMFKKLSRNTEDILERPELNLRGEN